MLYCMLRRSPRSKNTESFKMPRDNCNCLLACEGDWLPLSFYRVGADSAASTSEEEAMLNVLVSLITDDYQQKQAT